jgi:hypothetical protein
MMRMKTQASRTLAQYLTDNIQAKSIDFRLRILTVDPDGNIECYLHPLNCDGETIDFKIVNDRIEILDLAPCLN